MRIIKEHTGGGQTVEVRGLGLGMSAQATDPIVQIVHCDKENVWFSAPADDGRDKE